MTKAQFIQIEQEAFKNFEEYSASNALKSTDFETFRSVDDVKLAYEKYLMQLQTKTVGLDDQEVLITFKAEERMVEVAHAVEKVNAVNQALDQHKLIAADLAN